MTRNANEGTAQPLGDVSQQLSIGRGRQIRGDGNHRLYAMYQVTRELQAEELQVKPRLDRSHPCSKAYWQGGR